MKSNRPSKPRRQGDFEKDVSKGLTTEHVRRPPYKTLTSTQEITSTNRCGHVIRLWKLTISFNHNQTILLGREVKCLKYDSEPILIMAFIYDSGIWRQWKRIQRKPSNHQWPIFIEREELHQHPGPDRQSVSRGRRGNPNSMKISEGSKLIWSRKHEKQVKQIFLCKQFNV